MICVRGHSPLFYYRYDMINKTDILNIIQPIVEQKKAFIVDVFVSTANKIIVELDSFDKITIDDCVDVSRVINDHFDRETEDYELEVSSAGLSSAFKVIQQYQKNIGKEVETVTKDGKKLTGILNQVSEKAFSIDVKKSVKVEGKKKKQVVLESLEIPFEKVKSTKIVFNFN